MRRYYQQSPAKINLGLHILDRWPNGYHVLETLLIPYPALYDDLEVEILPGVDRLELTVTGENPIQEGENYIEVAYKLLQREVKRPLPALKVRLHKRIPVSAGLGGGSSNAGTFLRLLAEAFPELIPTEQQQAIAAQLGTDVPFFLDPRTTLASGLGTTLTPFEIDLSKWDFFILTPPVPCSTRYIYRALTPSAWSRTPIGPILQQDPKTWPQMLHNDLESVSFSIYPTLLVYKKALYDAGALYASMNGSGSSLYGLFPKAH